MYSKARHLCALIPLLGWLGCADGDGTPSPADASSNSEGLTVHDKDGGFVDGALVAKDSALPKDTALPDVWLTAKDGPLGPKDALTFPKKDGFLFPKKDGFLFPKKDGFLFPKTDAAGPQVDSAVAGCAADKDCKVFTDCCSCKAVLTSDNPGSCKMLCNAPKCTDWGLTSPKAYCTSGKCMVGDGTPNQCMTDKDCHLINDCCYCLGVPLGVAPPKCAIKTCFVNTCTGNGLSGTPAAKCLKGMCRISKSIFP